LISLLRRISPVAEAGRAGEAAGVGAGAGPVATADFAGAGSAFAAGLLMGTAALAGAVTLGAAAASAAGPSWRMIGASACACSAASRSAGAVGAFGGRSWLSAVEVALAAPFGTVASSAFSVLGATLCLPADAVHMPIGKAMPATTANATSRRCASVRQAHTALEAVDDVALGPSSNGTVRSSVGISMVSGGSLYRVCRRVISWMSMGVLKSVSGVGVEQLAVAGEPVVVWNT